MHGCTLRPQKVESGGLGKSEDQASLGYMRPLSLKGGVCRQLLIFDSEAFMFCVPV